MSYIKPIIGAIFFPLTKHKPAAISGININIIANNIVLFFNKHQEKNDKPNDHT